MKVVTDGGEEITLGTTEAAPTISLTDYSKRVTDDFGVTTVVERAYARRMTVRLSVPFEQADAVQRQLAGLRASPALWVADDRYSSLSVEGFYKDFTLDLNAPPISYCTLTVEGLAESAPPADAGGDPAPVGSASTLRLLQPATIAGANLISSNVPETDYPEWAAGTTYALGARVIKAATHRIYESVVAGNVGKDPAATPEWLEVGATNRWAMFDQALGSATTRASSIVVTLDVGAASAVALLDVTGATVRVQAPGYDQTQAVAAGPVAFLNLSGAAGQVTVTIAGPGQVAVGTLLLGKLVALGLTEAAPTAEITDFSRKEVDDFGEITVVERAWAKRMNAKALIRSDAVDAVAGRIAAVRARPSLWIGETGMDSLTVYGFFKDFSIEVGEAVSKLSLSIEGLSKAAPIAPPAAGPNWPDIIDSDPVNQPKPENGATVGAPPGTPVGDRPAETVNSQLDASASEIDQLWNTYGSTESAAQSALAAAASRDAAALARDTAQSARSVAETAAANATNAFNQAATAKDGAQQAEAGAVGARNLAQSAQSAAANSASAAAGSASSASTHAGSAASSASSAQGHATTASTAAGNASTSAGQASSSATSASGSASSAAASQTVAARAASDAAGAALNDNRYPGAAPSLWTGSWTDFAGAGMALGADVYVVAQRLRVKNAVGLHTGPVRPVAIVPGRHYRFRIAARAVVAGSDVLEGLVATFNQAGAFLNYTFLGGQALSTAADTAAEYLFSIGGSAGVFAFATVSGETPAFARPVVIARGNGGSITEAVEASLVDVEAERAAANAASAAATSASAASSSQTAAGQSASAADAAKVAAQTAKGQAETARTQAATSETNAAGSASSASISSGAAATARTAAEGARDTTLGYRDQAASSASAASTSASAASASQTAAGQSATAADAAKVAAQTAKGQAETARNQAATSETNAAGSASSASTSSSAAASARSAAEGARDSALGYRDQAASSASAAATSASAASASQTAAGNAATSASGHANTAQTQAGNAANSASAAATSNSSAASFSSAAGSSAAAAQASATLAASVSFASLNQNPRFSDFAAGATVPVGWGSRLSLMPGDRVPGENGQGYSWRTSSAAGSNNVFQQQFVGGTTHAAALDKVVSLGWYVVEVDIELALGTFDGVGFAIGWDDGNNTWGLTSSLSPFFAAKLITDNSGVVAGAGVVGRIYRFRKLVRAPSGARAAFIGLYGHMSEASSGTPGSGSIAAANQLIWRLGSLRPASQQEIEARQALNDVATVQAAVAVNSSAIAAVDGRTQAHWAVSANAGGATAAIEARAITTPGGQSASGVGIVAEEFSVTSIANGVRRRVLRIAGQEAVIDGSLTATSGIFLGSGTKWPVALRQKDYSVADGQAVSFGGLDLGSYVVEFGRNNLAPLASGETYKLFVDAKTGTGFTARLKIVTPGTSSTVSISNSTAPGSGPTRQLERGSNAEATGFNYTLSTSGTFTGSAYRDPETYGTNWKVTGSIVVDIWRRVGGVWSLAATETVFVQESVGGTGQHSVGWALQNTYILGSGVEAFGVTIQSHGGTAASFASLAASWSVTASSGERSATPNGQLSTITVRPV